MFRSFILKQWKASRLYEQRSRVGTQICSSSPSYFLNRTVRQFLLVGATLLFCYFQQATAVSLSNL